jgi:hypothetical protein
MKLAIMQPYFLPYIGYFQLVDTAERFIIYDNIKYTKKGWINRNRFLVNGRAAVFSIPLKKASDTLEVREREVSGAFDRTKLLNQFVGAYAKAPEFRRAFPVIEEIVLCPETNLFNYVSHAVRRVCSYLRISTAIVTSSEVAINHIALRAQAKVIALCEALGAKEYINPIGGTELYDRHEFKRHGLDLLFLNTGDVRYAQFGDAFVSSLSIIDVMMFNSVDRIRDFLKLYALT